MVRTGYDSDILRVKNDVFNGPKVKIDFHRLTLFGAQFISYLHDFTLVKNNPQTKINQKS